jgi:hypothetical protein
MAKFINTKVQDFGLDYIKQNCNKIALLNSYAFGDSYATVNGVILADAAMTSADLVIASSGNNRTLTTATKSDSSANATGDAANNHIAFLNTTGSEVLWVTDETSGLGIVGGVVVNFPSLVYTSAQPT